MRSHIIPQIPLWRWCFGYQRESRSVWLFGGRVPINGTCVGGFRWVQVVEFGRVQVIVVFIQCGGQQVYYRRHVGAYARTSGGMETI